MWFLVSGDHVWTVAFLRDKWTHWKVVMVRFQMYSCHQTACTYLRVPCSLTGKNLSKQWRLNSKILPPSGTLKLKLDPVVFSFLFSSPHVLSSLP